MIQSNLCWAKSHHLKVNVECWVSEGCEDTCSYSYDIAVIVYNVVGRVFYIWNFSLVCNFVFIFCAFLTSDLTLSLPDSGGSAVSSDFGLSHRDASVSGLASLSRLSVSPSVDHAPGQPGQKSKESSLSDLSHGTLRPRLIIICTSNSRLELTVTPASVQAILTYYKVCWHVHGCFQNMS